MKGASYKEVIELMEGKEEIRQTNPFVFATEPTKEHVVEDIPTAKVPTEEVAEDFADTENQNVEIQDDEADKD